MIYNLWVRILILAQNKDKLQIKDKLKKHSKKVQRIVEKDFKLISIQMQNYIGAEVSMGNYDMSDPANQDWQKYRIKTGIPEVVPGRYYRAVKSRRFIGTSSEPGRAIVGWGSISWLNAVTNFEHRTIRQDGKKSNIWNSTDTGYWYLVEFETFVTNVDAGMVHEPWNNYLVAKKMFDRWFKGVLGRLKYKW